MKHNLREKSLLLTAGGLILLVAGIVVWPTLWPPRLLAAGLLCGSGTSILIALLSYAIGYQRGTRRAFPPTCAGPSRTASSLPTPDDPDRS